MSHKLIGMSLLLSRMIGATFIVAQKKISLPMLPNLWGHPYKLTASLMQIMQAIE
jgi:hypothetical protein